jgi:hypothetical protein
MWLRKIQDRAQDPAHRENRHAVRPMTPMQVVRGIRMRHYAWGKPFQTIADEAGVTAETIRRVVNGEPFNDTTWALLVGYLRTPQSPRALIKNRSKGKVSHGPRRALEKRLWNLQRIALKLGFRWQDKTRLDEMTIGELWAFFYQLEYRVKERIIRERIDLARRFIIPDHLQAFEWIERLDQLAERTMTSGNVLKPSHPSEALRQYRYTKRKTPSR